MYETTTAGVTIQSPQLDINTVAAGGGSCLAFRNGLFNTGPESAGAEPGPTCYRYFSFWSRWEILIEFQEGWPTSRYRCEPSSWPADSRLFPEDFWQIRKRAIGPHSNCDGF